MVQHFPSEAYLIDLRSRLCPNLSSLYRHTAILARDFPIIQVHYSTVRMRCSYFIILPNAQKKIFCEWVMFIAGIINRALMRMEECICMFVDDKPFRCVHCCARLLCVCVCILTKPHHIRVIL